MSKHLPRSTSVYIRNRNYKNPELHTHLNNAQKYSNLLNHHFMKAEYQNHALQTASHVYLFSPSKSAGATRCNSANINGKQRAGFSPEQSTLGSTAKRPLSTQAKQFIPPFHTFRQFSDRTQKISQANEILIERQKQKKELDQRILQIKRLIMEERKKKSKISLECSKLINEREIAYADSLKKVEESRRNNIQICAIECQCLKLIEETEDVKAKTVTVKRQIAEEKQIEKETNHFAHETRILLRRERQKLAEAKQKKFRSYKSMSNQYMVMNRCKEEKAKLLNFIDKDVEENPICKPFGRVQ